MKVVVFVKISTGAVVEILPYRETYGKKVLERHAPFVMDLKIPCEDSKSHAFECLKCKYNDWEACDRIKYLRAIWTAGTVFDPPKPTERRYKIEVESFISKESAEIFKEDQSAEEKALILSRADKNPITEDSIIDGLERE